ncbi:MAG TPA: hypothetical protein VNQ79_21150 [Blastocatellia bacterium]|nr:hypothetical protein [Blastocatellia bacterium]
MLLSILSILSVSLSAQQQIAPKPSPKPEALAKTQLKIPVWIESEDGSFRDDAKRQQFKVFVDDREVAVKGFQTSRSGTVMLVVFDTVADLARVDEARSALQAAIADLSDQYWIGLLRAQDGLSVIQEPTSDHKILNEKISAVQVSGKAGLLDTLEPVAQLATAMLQKAGVRLSVLYITDSAIGSYRADYLNPVINSSDAGDLSRRFSDRAVQERMSRTVESLARFSVPIYVLHLAHRGDTLNLAYQSGLERIATESGGTAAFCRTGDEIRPALNGIINRIRSGYVLAIDPPNTRRQSVRIRVEVQNNEGKPPARITHINQLRVK